MLTVTSQRIGLYKIRTLAQRLGAEKLTTANSRAKCVCSTAEKQVHTSAEQDSGRTQIPDGDSFAGRSLQDGDFETLGIRNGSALLKFKLDLVKIGQSTRWQQRRTAC